MSLSTRTRRHLETAIGRRGMTELVNLVDAIPGVEVELTKALVFEELWDLKRDFGAAGDGVTDDTEAVQAFFDAAEGLDKTLFVPAGIYKITETITFKGNYVTATRLYGEQGFSRGLVGGSIFLWGGAAGGKMFKFRGLNNTTIEHLTFDGHGIADVCVHSSEYIEPAATNLIGSQRVYWNNCQFVGVRNQTTGTAFQVGLDDVEQPNFQCDTYVWDRCFFASSGGGAGFAALHFLTGGNAKNFVVRDCVFTQWDYGIYQPVGSGFFSVESCYFANIGYNNPGWAIYTGFCNSLEISSLAMENGGEGYSGGIFYADNGTCSRLSGGYFDGTADSDDYIIYTNGPTTIDGFQFEWNERVGANTCKIKVGDPTGDAALILTNNYFSYNSTVLKHPPVYDGSGNHVFESEYSKYTRLDVVAVGNKTSLIGADHNGAFPNIVGKPIRSNFGSPWTTETATGITVTDDGQKLIAVVPYSAFTSGSLTQTLTIARLFSLQNVKNIITKVTTNFAGVAGPVTCKVGTNSDDDAFIVSHTVSSGNPIKGLVDGDLGLELAASTRAHPNGYMVSQGASPYIQLTLTSASGILTNLSAGSITVIVEYAYLGNGGV